MRGPVFESRSRSSPASSRTSSQRSVRISLRRQPVSISRRIAAAAWTGMPPPASSSSSARPSRRNSDSVRKRSRRRRPVLGDRPAGVAARRGEPPVGRLLDQPGQRGDRMVGGRRAVGEAVLEGRDLGPPDRRDRLVAERRQYVPVDGQAVLRDCCRFATHGHIFTEITTRYVRHGCTRRIRPGEQRGGPAARPVGGDRPVPAEHDPPRALRPAELHHIGLAPRGLDQHPEPGELAVGEQGFLDNAERVHRPRRQPALARPSPGHGPASISAPMLRPMRAAESRSAPCARWA